MNDGTSLAGRSQEIADLERFLDTLPQRSATIILEGDAGIGKTVLWEATIEAAVDRGWQALTCRPGEFETDLVFAALSDLVEPVVALTDELPPQSRRALRAALLLDEPPDAGVDQRAVAMALLGLLRLLGRDGPVLLGVDDLQWIDTASAKVLQFAVRRLDRDPIGLVAATRPAAPGGAPERRWPSADRVTVGPLDVPAVETLVQARLSQPLRRANIRRICELSGGNPLFALELAATGAQPPGADEIPVPMPTSLEGLLDRRLAHLPRRTREGLLLVAVLAGQPPGTLSRALDAAGLDLPVLDAAVEAGVLRGSGERLVFAHPLFGSIAYWNASPSKRRDAHRLVGTILSGTAAGLRHGAMVADAPDADLAAALEAAAVRATTRGAPDAAATLLIDAVRLTPAQALPERVRRAVASADRYLDAGETDAAVAVLRGVAYDVPRGGHRARVLASLARAVGQVEGSRARGALLAEALGEVGDHVHLRCAIERDLCNAMSNYGDLNGSLVHGERALQLAAALADPVLVHGAEVGLAVTRLFLGFGPPADIEAQASDALARLRRGDHVHASAHMLDAMTWAAMLKWTDRFDVARDMLQRLLEILDERGEDGLTVPVLFQHGELQCWMGELSAASDTATACATAAVAAGQPAWIVMGLYLRALVDAERGSTDAALAAVTEGLRMAEQDDDARMVIRLLHVRGRVELSGPTPSNAAPYLTRALALAERCGYGEPGVFRTDADAVEALVAAGQLDEAERRTAELEHAGARLERPYAIATATRCRALLSYARGEHDAALERVGEAVEAHAALAQPIELGRTLLLSGTIQRRLRRKAAARAALESALTLFAEHQAEAWSRATRRELARIGGRTASPAALTASEDAIATLVSLGRRNKEISRELHVSEKTVEASLTRIYRKLGVRSRSELIARRLDQT